MKRKQIIGMLMALTMTAGQFGAVSALASEVDEATVSALDVFLEPDNIAKPMARMWFPDASAGVDDNDTIAKQIQELADEGFGGVEIAMLADSSNYTNAQASYAGWGTDAWISLLKKVYTAANSIEGGFVVDLTITSHWPPCLNTIDPNDDAASQEISMSYTRVTPEMLEDGAVQISLPETKTKDGYGANFIYTDTLSSAALAQVTDIEGETVTVDFGTMQVLDTEKVVCEDVSDLEEGTYKEIDGVYYAGSAAGVPDEETCEKYGWIYSSEEEDNKFTNETKSTVGAFGPAPAEDADFSGSYNGKIDENGLRARMADWQYYYTADLSDAEIEVSGDSDEIEAGDWIVVGTFYRGTGQIYSGSEGEADKQVTMENRCYVTNYFDYTGIEVVEDYWNNTILQDEELVEMMRINGEMGASIFEDSIEASTSTSFWAYDLADETVNYFGTDYEYANMLPFVVAGTVGEATEDFFFPGFSDEIEEETEPAEETETEEAVYMAPQYLDFSGVDEETVDRIEEDYNSLMGHLYNTQHCEVSNEWANSIGYSYRAQTYSLTGMDIAGAAASVNIPEAESGQTGDGHRMMSSAVNLYDKQCLSMEAVTGAMIYQFNWEDILYALTSDFSYGINHVILHGSAYSKSLNGQGADWPGWDPFKGSFGEPYTYRQIYWDSMHTVTDYIARNQAILQHGTAKIDLAVLIDGEAVFNAPSGNSFPTVLANGYSYNIMSEALLKSENAQKTDGSVIYADGPAYKAVVLDEVETISVEAMDILISYAEAGIPIVAVNSNPYKVYGNESGEENDANVQDRYQTLLTYDCVAEVDTEEEVPDALRALGVTGYAQYEIPNLEATLYQDEEANYYYLYNDTDITAGMLTASSAKKYKVDENVNTAVENAVITLEGTGTPYLVDAMTGEITQMGQYSDNGDGTISVVIDELPAGTSVWIAVTDSENFPAPEEYVTSLDSEDFEIVFDGDGEAALRSEKAGEYTVTMSAGEEKTVDIEEDASVLSLKDADWNLVIDSYGPTYKDASKMVDENGIQTVDPSDTTIVTEDMGTTALIRWEDLQASEEQLEEMGVESMEEVSGKGYYTTTFEWDGSKAMLTFAYGNDQVTRVTVNGTEITVINPLTDTVDLGDLLTEGENTLEIELCTTLSARATVEDAALAGGGLFFGGTTYLDNGLTDAAITSYSEAGLD